MREIFDRIERWLAANAPLVILNPPATERQLDEAEDALGVKLPPDVRESYLIHDGQPYGGGLFGGCDWHSLENVVREWTVWKELLDGGDFDDISSDADGRTIRTDWWNPRWIPFTQNGGGDSHCFDLEPGPEGVVGQIIEMIHDSGDRPYEAESLREWLQKFADDLEAGEYVYGEYGGVIRRDEI